jgi:hypothetical protein
LLDLLFHPPVGSRHLVDAILQFLQLVGPAVVIDDLLEPLTDPNRRGRRRQIGDVSGVDVLQIEVVDAFELRHELLHGFG